MAYGARRARARRTAGRRVRQGGLGKTGFDTSEARKAKRADARAQHQLTPITRPGDLALISLIRHCPQSYYTRISFVLGALMNPYEQDQHTFE